MIDIIPQDVNEIIYEFLLFSNKHNKFFCISKKITKNLLESYSYKKYIDFINQINMTKEDKNEYTKHIRENENIYKKWNRYNLYKWFAKKTYYGLWNKGDYVDAFDYVKGWCPAVIMNAIIERKTNIRSSDLCIQYERLYEIKFLGWADKYIEKVSIDKMAPLGKYTTNPLKLYESVSKDISNNEYYWALCKHENEKEWKMHRIIEHLVEEDSVQLLTHIGVIYKANKNNIHKVIRHITDASTFFSIQSEYCFFKRRTFVF